MKLKGRIAVVTGASRGIGKEIALELARCGATVVVNYAGNKEKAQTVVAEIKELGQEAIAVQCDVSNSDRVIEMFKNVIEQFGKIDILVNNAGVTSDNLLMRMKEDEWDRVIDTNLKGVFLCTKAVTRTMMKQRNGRIINVASVVGVIGNAGQANYVAAKAGVIGLTKTTARELAPRNITVNAVAPGFITTDMTEQLSQEMVSSLLGQIPLSRLGEPKDIAKVVAFLASDDSAYMTGQTLCIDGGMVM